MSTLVGSIALERGLRASFVKEWNAAENPSDIMPFVTETRSTAADEKYGWLGASPMMSEWVDERRLKALNSFSYSLVNKDFEATLSVDRNEIDDDQLGNVNIRIADLAQKAKAAHPRKLFFAALMAGTSALCYDGQPFFSASHSEGASGTQSNLLTGSGTSLEQILTDLDAAEAALQNFKDDIGEPINEGDMQLAVICPPALKAKFIKINQAEYITTGLTNVWKGRITLILSSGRLNDSITDFYVANLAPGIKPFIRQIRKPVTFSSLQGESEAGFMRKKYLYGVDSREVFGYGLWQKMVKVNNT